MFNDNLAERRAKELETIVEEDEQQEEEELISQEEEEELISQEDVAVEIVDKDVAVETMTEEPLGDISTGASLLDSFKSGINYLTGRSGNADANENEEMLDQPGVADSTVDDDTEENNAALDTTGGLHSVMETEVSGVHGEEEEDAPLDTTEELKYVDETEVYVEVEDDPEEEDADLDSAEVLKSDCEDGDDTFVPDMSAKLFTSEEESDEEVIMKTPIKKKKIRFIRGVNKRLRRKSNESSGGSDKKKKSRICSYIDAGYGANKDYEKWSDLLQALNDAFDEYMDLKNIKFDMVKNIMRYGSWEAIGSTVSTESDYIGLKTTEITGFMLTLSLFDPTQVDLTNSSNRTSNTSSTEWVYMAKSSMENGGYGLFAARTFHKDEKITIYVGRRGKKTTILCMDCHMEVR